MRKLRTFRALVAIVAVLAVFVAGQTPASAHQVTAFHTYDSASVSEDHMVGTVCDGERDGHWVIAYFWYGNNHNEYEFDGGDSGCDAVALPGEAYGITLCEETKKCVFKGVY